MIGLVGLLQQHGDAIEADFQQFYGTNLWRDLGTGRLRWPRLQRLVTGLPDDSRFVRRLSGSAPGRRGTPDIGDWPRQERLLASIIDELAIANWQRSGGKGKRPDLLTARKAQPKRLHVARQPTDPDVMKRRLAALYAGKEAT